MDEKKEHCKNSAPGSFAAIRLHKCSLLVPDNFVLTFPYTFTVTGDVPEHPGLLSVPTAPCLRPGGVPVLNPEISDVLLK